MSGDDMESILVVQHIEEGGGDEIVEIELPLEFEKLISVSSSQLSRVCRACLCEKGEMLSLLDTWDVDSLALAEILASIAAVQITFGDGLPESLCRDCVELLGKCYTFKQLCERSESMLRLILSQGHLQSQMLKDSETETPNTSIILKNVDETTTCNNEIVLKEIDNEGESDDNIALIPNDLVKNNDEEHKSSSFFCDLSSCVRPTSKQMKLSKLSIIHNQAVDIVPLCGDKVRKKKRKASKEVNQIEVVELVNVPVVTGESEDIKDELSLIKSELVDNAMDSDHCDEEVNFETPEDAKFLKKEFKGEREVLHHRKSHPSAKPLYSCELCQLEFKTSLEMKRHESHHKRMERINISAQLIEDENGKIRIPCTKCHLTFSSEEDLAIHNVVHLEYVGKKICQHCKKQFDTILQLKRHVRTHLKDKPFKCRICEKGFPEVASLTRHFRRHTGETIEKKHICKFCDKAYHDRHSLNVHMRKHTGERPWICCECGRGFIDSRLLNSHMKVHRDEKPHACNVCDKRFRHESTLTSHVRIHTGEKPYICTVCGNAFVQSSNLALHMRTHTQERPYSCESCPKKFTSSSALTTHKRCHTGEKPYSCNICHKKFVRQILSSHMCQHTGDKPHKCSVCAKRFATIGQLTQHTRVHTGEKPFVCQICRKGCITSSYLKRHMLRAHNSVGIWQLPEDLLRKHIPNLSPNNKANDKVRSDEIVPSANEIITVDQNALFTYTGGMVNVVTLASSSGDVSILSQKEDLSLTTLRTHQEDSINQIIAKPPPKLFEISQGFLKLEPLQTLSTGQVAITEINHDSQ